MQLAWRTGRTAVVAAVLCSRGTAAQGTPTKGVIDGVVTDTSLASLVDATTSIVGSSLRIVTGSNGRFRITGLAPGQYVLLVQKRGYVASSTVVEIAPADTLRMSIMLQPGAESVVDETGPALAAFEARRRAGYGRFMTQAEIATRKASTTRDLLRGFSILRIQGNFASVAHASTFRDACAFQLFVDGKPLQTTSLDALPPPKELVAIEVYGNVGLVPLEYRSAIGDHCGAILTWTRSAS
jgi:Carboxypeptidase regulatory-like domain